MILAICANPSVDTFWSVSSLEKRSVNRSSDEEYYPGGKGIHVAFALQELGEKVTLLGLWGGQTGTWLKKKCQNKDITTIGPSVSQWNRLCISMKSNGVWNETELLGAGPEINLKTENVFKNAYNDFIINQSPRAVVVSGSVPIGMGNQTYHQLVTKAQSLDIPTFVDASGDLLKETLSAHPYAIHLNLHEGQALSDYKKPADIARWLGNHCTVAAVTDGADGLYLWVDKQLYHIYCKLDIAEIVSTIGAGDCLLAGLCRTNLIQDNPQSWGRYAVACGSANCIHPQLGMLKKEDVKNILEKVNINQLCTNE